MSPTTLILMLGLVPCVTVFGLEATLGMPPSEIWVLPLLLWSIAAAGVAWNQIRWPDEFSKWLSFISIVLVGVVLRRAFRVADYILHGDRMTEWPFYTSRPEYMFFKADVITIIGLLITVFSLIAAGGLKYSPSLILRSDPRRMLLTLWAFYFMSLIAAMMTEISPGAMGSMGQLMPTILSLGSVSLLFICLVSTGNRIRKLVLLIFGSAPFLWAAVSTGMKTELVVAILPAMLYSWITWKSVRARAFIFASGLVALGFITVFVSFYRAEVWIGGKSLSRIDAIVGFLNSEDGNANVDVVNSGLTRLTRRVNTTSSKAWAVAKADEDQFQPQMVLGPMIYVFIPRIVWPDKPAIEVGIQYTKLVFGRDSRSSTSAGLYTGFYLGYGWIAVVVGSMLVGTIIAFLIQLAARIGGGLFVGLYTFGLIPMALKLDEMAPMKAISGPIVSFVYTGIIVMAVAYSVRFFLKNDRI